VQPNSGRRYPHYNQDFSSKQRPEGCAEDKSETESGPESTPAPEQSKPDNLTNEQEAEWEQWMKKRKRADERLDRIKAAAQQDAKRAADQEVIRRIWRRTVSTRPVSVDTYDKNKCGLYLNIACLVEGGAFTKLREDAFNGKLGQTVRGWEARAREHGNGDMGYENLHWVPDPDPYDDQEQEERFLKKAEEYALHLLREQGYKRTGPTHEDFTFGTAEERETRTLEAMEKAMKAMCDQRNQVVYDAE